MNNTEHYMNNKTSQFLVGSGTEAVTHKYTLYIIREEIINKG